MTARRQRFEFDGSTIVRHSLFSKELRKVSGRDGGSALFPGERAEDEPYLLVLRLGNALERESQRGGKEAAGHALCQFLFHQAPLSTIHSCPLHDDDLENPLVDIILRFYEDTGLKRGQGGRAAPYFRAPFSTREPDCAVSGVIIIGLLII